MPLLMFVERIVGTPRHGFQAIKQHLIVMLELSLCLRLGQAGFVCPFVPVADESVKSPCLLILLNKVAILIPITLVIMRNPLT